MKKIYSLIVLTIILFLNGQAQVIGDFRSLSTGSGNWGDYTSWEIFNGTGWVPATSGQLPSAANAVEIQAGYTMTINTAIATPGSSGNLTVNGSLTYIATPASALSVSGNVVVSATGSFTSPSSGTTVTNTLGITGDLTVDGIFNMNVFSTAGVTTTFTGATNNVINGAGTTINFYILTVNKGAAYTNILEVTSVITIAPPPSAGMRLNITNGTFKLSSASILTPYYAGVTLLGANGRLWLNNAAASVSSVGAGTNVGAGRLMVPSGRLQITAGTFSYGSGSDIHSFGNGGPYLTLEGPNATMNIYGSLQLGYSTNFTMSAGNLNIYPQVTGSSPAGFPAIAMESYFLIATNYLLTGGTITIVDPPSGVQTAVNCSLSNGSFNLSGVTLRLGDGTSDKPGSANGFLVNANVPIGNVIVNNNPASVLTSRIVKMNGAFAVGSQLTINSGTANQFLLNGFVLTIAGNLSNSGTFTGDALAANGIVFNGTTQQVVSGAGTFTNSNINNITINNTSGASPSVDLQVPISVSNSMTLTNGTLGTTNASVFTIGKSATSTTFTMTRSGGSFALTPVFSLGGVTTINYAYTAPSPAASVTTGAELPAATNLNLFTVNNPSGLTLDKAVSTTTLALTAGILTTTAANSITVLGSTVASITGGSATAYVNGPLTRTLPNNASNANYKFFIGKTAYHLFEYETITTGGTGTATMTAEVFDAGSYSGSPGTGMATINTDKYWALQGNLGTVTITSSKIRLTEAGMTAVNKIGQSNTSAGSYNNVGGILGTGTISTNKVIDYTALSAGTYFRIGTAGAFTAGTYAIGPNGPYGGYAGTYATVQNAIDAVTDVSLGGNVIFEIQPDYVPTVEIFPLNLTIFLGASASATLTIRPAASVSTVINLSSAGTVLSNVGADYIIFDGRPGGAGSSKMLQFTNTTTTGSTVLLSADAQYDQFLYCILKGSVTTAVTGILTINAPSTGNNFVTIDHCNFDGSGSANMCLYTTGIAANATISNNNFYDYRNGAGIYLASGSDAAIISGNSFYQTAAYTGFAGTTYGIYIGGNFNTYQVFGNNIGGSGPAVTGTWTVSATTPAAYNFTGIYMSAGTLTLSKIYNNKVQGFDWKSTPPATFTGINVATGLVNVGTDGANLIGSNTGNDNIKVTYYTSNGAATVYGITVAGTNTRIENNNIGAITTLLSGVTGVGSSIIGINSSTPTCVIRNNVIGSTTSALSINAANQSTTGNVQNVYGINTTSTTNITINNNTIANLYNGMTFASASAGFLRGIKLSSGATAVVDSNLICTFTTPQPMTGSGISTFNIIGIDFNYPSSTSTTIMGNTIYELTNTSSTGAVGVIGIYFHGSTGAGNKIDKNLVHSFVTSSATAVQTGFLIDLGTCNFQNNVIRLGIDKAGLSITSTAQINGISKTGGNLNCYFNTVYIGGSGVSAGTASTYAFSQTVHGVEDIRDNIFLNMRTNAVANKLNYAVSYPAGITSNFTSDYNIYNVSVTDGKLAKVGTADQTNIGALIAAIQGSDLHSAFGEPLLTSPGTDITSMSLVPQNFTPAEGQGVAIATVTDDYTGSLRSGLTPVDIGAYAGNYTPPGAGQDIWYPVISYIPLLNTGLITNRTTVNFASITDNFTGVNTTAGTKPRMYYKKSTDANVFAGNTSADNGWKWVEANNSTSPFDFTIDYSIIFGGSVSIGDSIRYFVVAQDLATTPNVSFNPSNGASGTSVAPGGMTFPTTQRTYTIAPTIASAVDVGTGYTYPTLTGPGGLFAAINTGVINSNVVATIRTDLVETGVNGLNLITEEGANAGTLTLTIQSDVAAHLVSGGTSPYTTPMIPINGACRVIINGGASKFLTFRNANAAYNTTGPVIQFNNGSQNCLLENCIIESNAYALQSPYIAAEVLVGNTGSNSVTITNNDIRDSRGTNAGSERAGIYSNSVNNSLVITNNNIYNFKTAFYYETSYGIYLGAVANGCVITGNSIYQESTSNPVCALIGIYIAGGNSHNISNNYIGGSGPACAGTWVSSNNSSYGTTGIYVTNGTSPASTIQGNIIQNFNISGTPYFYGLENASGVANFIGNTVGSATVANSIQLAGASSVFIPCGLYNVTPTGTCNFDQNIVANITMTAASGSAYFRGMQMSGGNVRKNQIFNIGSSVAAVSPVIYGIYNATGQAANEFSNNMISLNGGASTNPILAGYYDVSSAAGTTGFYFNTINLYGTATGTAATYSYYRSGTAGYILNNNILANLRSGTGTHYAIFSTTTSSFVSDLNDLVTAGANFASWGGAAKTNMAAWQAIPMDVNSFNIDPLFVSGTDLHSAIPQLNNGGVSIPGITTDNPGAIRTNPPDIGAYEFVLPITAINTIAAAAILGSSATVRGNINTTNELVTMSFEYGLTNTYGSTAAGIPAQIRSLASIADSAFITGLAPNTLYHYRAVGTSATSSEIVYGADMTFTTSGGVAGLWTGVTSTDWATPSNWDNQFVPANITNVVIPAAAPNWPVYSGTLILGSACNSITLAGAASMLTVTLDMTVPAGFTVTNKGTIHLLTH